MVNKAQEILKHDPVTQADQESVQGTIIKLKSKSATLRSGESLENQLALRLATQNARTKVLADTRSHLITLFDSLGVKNADDAIAAVQQLKATPQGDSSGAEVAGKQVEIDTLKQQLQEQKDLNKDLAERNTIRRETSESHAQEAQEKKQGLTLIQRQLEETQQELQSVQEKLQQEENEITQFKQAKETVESDLSTCKRNLGTAQKKVEEKAALTVLKDQQKDQKVAELEIQLRNTQDAHQALDLEHTRAHDDHTEELENFQQQHNTIVQEHDKKIQEYENTLDVEQEEHDEALVQASDQHIKEQQEKDKKIKEQQDKIAGLEREKQDLNQTVSTTQRTLTTCKQERDKQKTEIDRIARELQNSQSVQAQQLESIRSLKQDHKSALDVQKEEHSKEIKGHEDALSQKEKDNEVTLKVHEEVIAQHLDATQEHAEEKSSKDATIQAHDTTIKTITAEKDQLTQRLESCKEDLKDKNADIKKKKEAQEKCMKESKEKDSDIKELKDLIQYPQIPELTQIAMGQYNYDQLINVAKEFDPSEDRFKDKRSLNNTVQLKVLKVIDLYKMPKDSKAKEQLAKKIEECKPKLVSGEAMGAIGSNILASAQKIGGDISEECKADKIKVTRLKILGNYYHQRLKLDESRKEQSKTIKEYVMPILENKSWESIADMGTPTRSDKGLKYPVEDKDYNEAMKDYGFTQALF